MKTDAVQRTSGSVRFTLRDSKGLLESDKKAESPIIVHFNYGRGRRFNCSTGYKTCYDDWDYKNQRLKNKSTILNKDKVNRDLKSIKDFIEDVYLDLSTSGERITPAILRSRLREFLENGLVRESKPVTTLSFFQIINKYIAEKEHTITKVTARAYKQTKKQLEEFEKKKKFQLEFDTIDMNFYYEFTSFLESKGFYLNTIGKHIKTLKTFCSYAIERGYSNNLQYKNKDFKILREITTEIYLNEDELTILYERDLSNYPEHEHARDIFLIGCYTGQRVSDYNNFTEDDIVERDGVKYFKIKQKKNRKSGRTVLCPITTEIRTIMEKRHNGLPPKPMPEPFINKFIKEVAQDAGIDEKVKCEYTKGGKIVQEMVPKYELIKTHTARRSFCTNKYKAGMNVFDIMLFSGHTTEKEFYKYIRIKDEERAYHIAKNGFFNI